MRVEGQRRIAQQQRFVGHDVALPSRVAGRGGRGRCRRAGRGRLAIHDVVLFFDRGDIATANAMADRHETELARAALLFADIEDARFARDAFTDDHRRGKAQTPAGPHAARQAEFRQEAAFPWMPVLGDERLPHDRPEENPVPQGRKRVALVRRGIVIERGGERRDGGGRDDIGGAFRLHGVVSVAGPASESWLDKEDFKEMFRGVEIPVSCAGHRANLLRPVRRNQ
jgi:hypothetical protein